MAARIMVGGGVGRGDVGAWREIPSRNNEVWQTLKPAALRRDSRKHSKLDRGNHSNHSERWVPATTLFEVCLEEAESVWFMLHSGTAFSIELRTPFRLSEDRARSGPSAPPSMPQPMSTPTAAGMIRALRRNDAADRGPDAPVHVRHGGDPL